MALLNDSSRTSKELSLENGVLKTNGALVSIKAPAGWTATKSSKTIQPAMLPETYFLFRKSPDSKTSIGVYFSGMVLDDVEASVRKRKIFDNELRLKAGSPEATRFIAEEGALSKITELRNIIMSAAPHAVQSEEKYCLAVKSTDFNGLKSIIFEFQNETTGYKSIEYCLDVLGNGQVVYILYYRAAIDSFADDMDTAINSFRSSVWRSDFDPNIALDVVT